MLPPKSGVHRKSEVKLCARVAVVCMNLCTEKGGREVVEGDETRKGGELKKVRCGGELKRTNAWESAKLWRHTCKGKFIGQTRTARGDCPEIREITAKLLGTRQPVGGRGRGVSLAAQRKRSVRGSALSCTTPHLVVPASVQKK